MLKVPEFCLAANGNDFSRGSRLLATLVAGMTGRGVPIASDPKKT
jgi:hypothetical protein